MNQTDREIQLALDLTAGPPGAPLTAQHVSPRRTWRHAPAMSTALERGAARSAACAMSCRCCGVRAVPTGPAWTLPTFVWPLEDHATACQQGSSRSKRAMQSNDLSVWAKLSKQFKLSVAQSDFFFLACLKQDHQPDDQTPQPAKHAGGGVPRTRITGLSQTDADTKFFRANLKNL